MRDEPHRIYYCTLPPSLQRNLLLHAKLDLGVVCPFSYSPASARARFHHGAARLQLGQRALGLARPRPLDVRASPLIDPAGQPSTVTLPCALTLPVPARSAGARARHMHACMHVCVCMRARAHVCVRVRVRACVRA